MMRGTRAAAWAWLGCLLVPGPAAAADDLELSFDAGRVTVVAKDVPLRTIIDEWARLGDTTFVEASQVSSQPVSVEMLNVPEREALRVLLRSVGGYVVAPRATRQAGVSAYDRVLIMATSRRRARRPSAPTPPAFNPTSGQPQFGEPALSEDSAPPGLFVEPDDAELDQLELLEQLRGRYESEPPPDPFSQPSFLPADQQGTQDDGSMQATPFPGMITGSSDELQRPRRARPVSPQRDDP